MITLNLIPEIHKDKYRLIRVYQMLKTMVMVITIYTIVVAIIILMARFILQLQFTKIINETTLVTQENHAIEEKITKLNKEISIASSIKSQILPWPEFLESFSSAVPDNVIIKTISFSLEKGANVTGNAVSRDDLLKFRDNLLTNPAIKNIELPIGDLLTKNNVDFNMKFTLDLSKVSVP